MPFPVGIVDAALGYSIIYEEYKGDYAEAERLAEQALADARQSGEPTALADALRARGVVALLQGDAAKALALFEELETLVPEDPIRVLWARAYALVAFMLEYKTFPNGAVAGGAEINLRSSLSSPDHRLKNYFAQQEAAEKRLGPASKFISDQFWTLPLARGLAASERRIGARPGLKGAWKDALGSVWPWRTWRARTSGRTTSSPGTRSAITGVSTRVSGSGVRRTDSTARPSKPWRAGMSACNATSSRPHSRVRRGPSVCISRRPATKKAEAARQAGDQVRYRLFVEKGFGYAERGKARGLLGLMASGAVSASLDAQASAPLRAWRQANAKLTTWRGLLAAERASPKRPALPISASRSRPRRRRSARSSPVWQPRTRAFIRQSIRRPPCSMSRPSQRGFPKARR